MNRLLFAALLAQAPLLLAQTPPPKPLMPSQTLDPGIVAVRDIPYTAEPVDSAKQALDVYHQESAKNAPVLVFVHGGAWVRGDRKQYPFLANRFAREGYVVVVPSYRLSPRFVHPAHIEDVASAVAWTFRNIGSYGGDPKRIVLAGHSAGGHLVSLLATNPQWLMAHDLEPGRLRGVIGLSGVYDFTGIAGRASGLIFGRDPEQLREVSPRLHVTSDGPPFLLTYCQFDYPTLPEQAKDFHESLIAARRTSTLVYVQGESHIFEILSIVKEGDATARAMLEFLNQVSSQ
jgi:acetyl esterase/lipase